MEHSNGDMLALGNERNLTAESFLIRANCRGLIRRGSTHQLVLELHEYEPQVCGEEQHSEIFGNSVEHQQ